MNTQVNERHQLGILELSQRLLNVLKKSETVFFNLQNYSRNFKILSDGTVGSDNLH